MTTIRADESRAAARAAWRLGDYHAFALRTVWGMGPLLVEACGIGPGDRVLDVAAGTGNTAIRAAEAGARVVASDITPENFAAGRREARARSVELEWVEADAQDLPFPDGAFDVVTSSFGAIFAPDHAATAREMTRVCRPGGVVGMLNFTPEGLFGAFLEALAPHAPPPPPGASSPALWGDEAHVRALLGDRVDDLRTTRGAYVERAESPAEYVRLLRETFGPIVALHRAVEARPEARAALEADLRAFAERADTGPAGGPAEYRYEYLLLVARRAAGH